MKYTKGLSFSDFEKDDKTLDAVIRSFEIIGEAANSLSQKLLNDYNEVQWGQIIGLRNRLIHSYFGVDNKILWTIIKNNLLGKKNKSIKSLRRSGLNE